MHASHSPTFLSPTCKGWPLLLVCLSLVLALLSPATAQAEPPQLTLHYHERPPYMSTDANGTLHGLVASPAIQALTSIGIELNQQKTPAARQLNELSHSDSPQCALGWFRNPERESRYRYSLPLYQDQALIGITQRSQVQLQPVAQLRTTMQHPTLTALVKQGYSYGPYIDDLISRSSQVSQVTGENNTMLTMIAAGRADYMLLAPEEYTGLLQQNPHQREQFNAIEFTDLERGETRHLVCNQATPEAWLQGVDEWIRSRLVIPPSAAAGFEKHISGAT